MPRQSRPWFRFYSEALSNHKLQSLPAYLFKTYFNLLCVASENDPRGVLPSIDVISFRLRLSRDETLKHLSELRQRRFIEGDRWHPQIHDWHDWQYDSDTYDTPGRRDRNHVGTRKERATNAVGTPRSDKEKEEEKDKEREETENAPAHPFAFAYARKYQERHSGRPPPPTEHGAALALEREYGSDACLELAGDLDWQKHPNYMRPMLKERREREREGNGTSNGASLRVVPARTGWEVYGYDTNRYVGPDDPEWGPPRISPEASTERLEADG